MPGIKPADEKLQKYYQSFAARRKIPRQSVEDVAQEMFCLALETQARQGIPYWQQSKWFLFSRATKYLFKNVKYEIEFEDTIGTQRLWNWLDVNWCNTSANGRRFLKKYRVTANQKILELDAWEIIEFLNVHKNTAPLNAVTSLRNHPHTRWLVDGKLYASKREYAFSCGKEKIYKYSSREIEGELVTVRIA